MRQTPQTYAITIVCAGRERVFLHLDFAERMVRLLARYRAEGRFRLHGFAVMPDHIHVLLSPQKSIEATVGLIKGGFSFAVKKEWRGVVWQDGYYTHRVISQSDFESQLRYIADNPARWSYRDYPHVHSAHPEIIDPRPEHLCG